MDCETLICWTCKDWEHLRHQITKGFPIPLYVYPNKEDAERDKDFNGNEVVEVIFRKKEQGV